MDAGLSVFLEHGYERATIDQIIALAGGSKSAVYDIFGGKDGLLFAILRRTAEDISTSGAQQLPDKAEQVRPFLVGVAKSIVRNVLREDIIGLYCLAVEASRRNPKIGELYYAAGPLKAQGDFSKLLASFDKRGLLRVPDTELASRFFFGMLLDKAHLAMSLGQMKPPTPRQCSRLAEGAVDVFLAAFGLHVQPSSGSKTGAPTAITGSGKGG
jgi:AcrR family transcriptional regulator